MLTHMALTTAWRGSGLDERAGRAAGVGSECLDRVGITCHPLGQALARPDMECLGCRWRRVPWEERKLIGAA